MEKIPGKLYESPDGGTYTYVFEDPGQLMRIGWRNDTELHEAFEWEPKKEGISRQGVEMLKTFEGYRSKAYQDSAKIWTIGYGTTMYPNGTKVKKGDTCEEWQADAWLRHDLEWAVKAVESLTRSDINQNQKDALISFTYNVGQGAYRDSTLRKLINKNPKDLAIRAEFMKWVRAGGKVITGLKNRRKKEADLYFS